MTCTLKFTVSPKLNGGVVDTTVRFTTGAWLPIEIRTEFDAERPVRSVTFSVASKMPRCV